MAFGTFGDIIPRYDMKGPWPDYGLEFLLAFDGRIHYLEEGYWFAPKDRDLEGDRKLRITGTGRETIQDGRIYSRMRPDC